MSIWLALLIATAAAISMVIQDSLTATYTVAVADGKAHLAAWMDVAQWLLGITTTFVAVDALNSHSWTEKILVVLFVSAANYSGTLYGVRLGHRVAD